MVKTPFLKAGCAADIAVSKQGNPLGRTKFRASVSAVFLAVDGQCLPFVETYTKSYSCTGFSQLFEVSMVPPARWASLCVLMVALSTVAADWRAELPTAQPLGAGDFTWFGVRLYSARLWTVGPVQDWNQPFALELRYHRSLSKETLVDASLAEIRRLNANITPQQRAAWSKALEAAFVDVRPGMRITGVYLPGQGSRFYVDGTLSQVIADPEFSRAFFAIWLDPRARDPQLRQRLLGRAGNDRGT